jgi:hypothetical protein
VLVPEPTNPYDPNAVAVHVQGHAVGYLARATAQQYLPGLHHAMSAHGAHIALTGVIVGGGHYADGPGRLGVWLEHDPADFGMAPTQSAHALPPGYSVSSGAMRTGFTEAWLSDLEDDSYDLSWFNELPEADRPAIAQLRRLLEADPDPIDRHFQFTELESRLYRSRDLFDSALNDYDEVCARHDAEMETICAALIAKWGKVPLLDTYRQMAIRQQKKRDWNACLWWANRGLALYGQRAAREEAVEDLRKRRNRAMAKLEGSTPPSPGQPLGDSVIDTRDSDLSQAEPPEVNATQLEVLTCRTCNREFERLRVRGRKPTLCPTCRSAAGQ